MPVARTRIKICGITRPQDAREAARLGADAIGLVFYPASPRVVNVEQARQIVQALPPFVTVVGLFVNAQPDDIEAVLAAVPIELLQFHGEEPPEACGAFGVPYIKVVRVRNAEDVARAQERYVAARGLLLDTYKPEVPGGTGETFDWALVPAASSKPLILAGGLTAANVGAAIRQARPYGVDVSGGVEESKGIKSAAKMAAFINSVKASDEEREASK